MWYDDEGTLMIAFRDLVNGRRLYDDIFSLYGPFYFISIGSLFTVIRLPISHDVVRFISAVFWLLLSIIMAGLVYRLTRSLIACGFAYLTALLLLKMLTHSPTHPQEMCLLLVGLLPYLLWRIAQRPTPASLAIIGAIVSALLLTKFNLGIFVAIALALAAIRATLHQPWRDWAFAATTVAGLLLPVALMLPLFRLPWVFAYCGFATATVGSAILVWSRIAVPEILTLRHWSICLGAAAVTAIVTLGIVLVGGTSPHAIFYAVILQNVHLIQNWYIPTQISAVAGAAAAASLIMALAYVHLSSQPARYKLAQRMVLRLKLWLAFAAIAFVILAALCAVPWQIVPPIMFSLMMPFCWLLIVPPLNQPGHNLVLIRGGIGLLAAFMVLYPFPVAGTQLMIAVLIICVMLPVLLHDAIVGLELLPGFQQPDMTRWRRGGSAIVVILLGAMLGRQSKEALDDYFTGVPLSLPGASLIHVSPDVADSYHWVVHELSHCEMFYTMPGLFSFYFWTGKPTPTGLNNNDALGLLTWLQQGNR